MKKYLLLAVLFASACRNEPSVIPDAAHVDMDNITTTAEFAVPVREGMTTVVCNAAGDEIARTSVPLTILLDKAETPSLAYVESVAGEENQIRTNLWQVVAFEDSLVGDYDYNDFVFHVKYELSGRNFFIGIQPIALGSTKKIRLGCDLWQNGRYLREGIIVAENCRDKFFPGTENRMINTFNVEKEFCVFDYKPYFRSNLIVLDDATHPVYVNWFIEVDNDLRLYAVSTARTSGMLDGNKRPYGLVFTSTGNSYEQAGQGTVGHDWFNYPQETVPIDRVYPLFGKWLAGEYEGTLQSMYDPSAEGSYDAIGNGLYIVPNNMTSAMDKPSVREHVIPWGTTQAAIDGFDW